MALHPVGSPRAVPRSSRLSPRTRSAELGIEERPSFFVGRWFYGEPSREPPHEPVPFFSIESKEQRRRRVDPSVADAFVARSALSGARFA